MGVTEGVGAMLGVGVILGVGVTLGVGTAADRDILVTKASRRPALAA